MTRAENDVPIHGEDAGRLAEDLAAADGLFLGLDFDGTLAPIVTDPAAATMDPAAIEPLEALADREDVRIAIVSGRALEDLVERSALDGIVYGGNHGLELQGLTETNAGPSAEAVAAVDDARRRIAVEVAPVPGCVVEDKGPTFSVHVRQTPSNRVEDVRSAVADVVADEDLRLVEGKQVFEVRPAGDHDKGWAMETLESSIPENWLTIYVGDDRTDEDAFRTIQPEGIGVHVGDGETTASLRLPGQEHVEPFLSWLAEDGLDVDE